MNGPAAQIIEAVDMTADPCQDFFQFACGSWNKKHIIPEDKTSYNPFEKLNDELQVILKSKCCRMLSEFVHSFILAVRESNNRSTNILQPHDALYVYILQSV